MSKRVLEIRFSRESRINDHGIDRYTLYVNGRATYYARYKSCVVNYINENYAKGKNARLNQKMKKLGDKHHKLGQRIYEIRSLLAKPLIEVK